MKNHQKSIKPFGLRVRKLETENILIDEKNYKNLETHLFLLFFFFSVGKTEAISLSPSTTSTHFTDT